MENYIKSIIIVSASAGLVSVLSSSMREGLKKALSLVSSLVLISAVILPIYRNFKENGIDGLADPVNVPPVSEIVSEAEDVLIPAAQEALEKNCSKMIAGKFGIEESGFSIVFVLSPTDSSLEIESITLTLKSLSVLSLRDEISSYIEKEYYVYPAVIEDIRF